MLKFQETILEESLKNDGLWILAKGIGLNKILSSLISQYVTQKLLVIVLNLHPSKLDFDTSRKFSYITSDFPSKQRYMKFFFFEISWLLLNFRESLYLQGGVLFITNRIFVVDFLLKRVPPHLIAGIIGNNFYYFCNLLVNYLHFRSWRCSTSIVWCDNCLYIKII